MHTVKTYIVEDSPVIRSNLISALEELVPVKVVGTAEDELSAIKWLADASNDAELVIIDIFLKAGDGLGVLRAAQDVKHGRSLVVLSNFATPDMRRKCAELGAEQVFDKSNQIDDLIQYCGRLAESDNEVDRDAEGAATSETAIGTTRGIDADNPAVFPVIAPT